MLFVLLPFSCLPLSRSVICLLTFLLSFVRHFAHLQEFDTPHALLSRPTSMFNKLVDDTGPHASGTLRRMAEEGPKDEEEADK